MRMRSDVMDLVTQRVRLFVALTALLVAARPGWSATLTVTPSAISNTYSGMIAVDIGGLATGETVALQHYLDLNGNGVLDSTDWLLQQVQLTDGAVPLIGGATNYSAPYDRTGTDGAISALLNYAKPTELTHLVGRHLLRVQRTSGALTNSLLVTNYPFGQTVRGTVRASGTNVPYAVVVFLDMDGELVAGTVASATGGYTNQLPPGSYVAAALRPGYVADFAAAVTVSLTNGATVTTNLSLLPVNRTSLSGRLVDSANQAVGLPGVPLFVAEANGRFAIGSSDPNGAFNIPVTDGLWRVEPGGETLAALGYVGLDEDALPVFDTSTGNVTNAVVAVPKANALFHGVIRTTAGLPLAGATISARAEREAYEADTLSDTNGLFALPVLGGRSWWISGDPQWNAGLGAYVIVAGTNSYVASNRAVRLELAAMAVTGTIRGWVRDSASSPITGARVYAWAQIGSTQFSVGTETDDQGNYTLLVGDGTWHVGVECWDLNARGYDCVPEQQVTVPPTNAVANFTAGQIAPLQITTVTLPGATVGQWYQAYLNATGGTQPYSWTLAPGSGPLPPGLSLYNDGSISGSPLASGTFNFTVRVTDSRGTNASRGLSITVVPGPIPLRITTTSLPSGTVGQSYSATLQAEGGQPPYAWALQPGSGPLPPGLNLYSDGTLSGTPLSAGTFNFMVGVRDWAGSMAGASLAITISLPPMQPPVIQPPQRTADGRFQFSFSTVAGRSYTVLQSTTLTNWVPLLSFQGTGGPVTLVDWGTPNSKRFYRVSVSP